MVLTYLIWEIIAISCYVAIFHVTISRLIAASIYTDKHGILTKFQPGQCPVS